METSECRAQGRKGIACKAGDNNQMMMEQVAREIAAVWEYSEARALALAWAWRSVWTWSEHVSGNSQCGGIRVLRDAVGAAKCTSINSGPACWRQGCGTWDVRRMGRWGTQGGGEGEKQEPEVIADTLNFHWLLGNMSKVHRICEGLKWCKQPCRPPLGARFR